MGLVGPNGFLVPSAPPEKLGREDGRPGQEP